MIFTDYAAQNNWHPLSEEVFKELSNCYVNALLFSLTKRKVLIQIGL